LYRSTRRRCIGRHSAELVTRLLDGRVPRSSCTGLHRSRLALHEGVRVLIPRQRVGAEDITGAHPAEIDRLTLTLR
jgi:hypothetical protein